ncbi:MAG: hypothetical protein E7B04_09325 [Staphylococcus epidermidis]|nr:hypothetical protein [Staphylococcus epidermidis]
MDHAFIEKNFPFIKSSIGIIEHGSTAMGFSNADSDVDLVAVYNNSDVKKIDKLVVQMVGKSTKN